MLLAPVFVTLCPKGRSLSGPNYPVSPEIHTGAYAFHRGRFPATPPA
ncbi:hypothetical protein HJTV-2_gp138 [Haloarcula virus HJTV-2]|uniref:Uncharacterized protein n=1 Tax=Haloarcula virus HJTV-2 TaxID=2877986 RepID=A0AAE9BXA8_9CAUD|nr:hypothetical protein M1M33_gp009 [Haloarcula virus HJTV-2]UBF21618.1 hypothetical protein HRTV-24_gp132 [Halorubrum virus HRTV-24]UBF21887.1 hypothetical protein HSTV-3_gp127 [Halorubrum virus HSTV-3]UBF22017.1 hypothetical protein HJTV-3_gp128 [Haloarcula virus HJTV-3]UBF22146.1 hypothetical protein HRTV-15_gp127 [Halorubrum virus HRTV-15]UBF21758.1 hypothetical protein HJTV-2_gp138 [Haloarcula virus HJTV-2]